MWLWRPIGPLGLCASLKAALLEPLPSHHRAALLVAESQTWAVKGLASTITHPVIDCQRCPRRAHPRNRLLLAFSYGDISNLKWSEA